MTSAVGPLLLLVSLGAAPGSAPAGGTVATARPPSGTPATPAGAAANPKGKQPAAGATPAATRPGAAATPTRKPTAATAAVVKPTGGVPTVGGEPAVAGAGAGASSGPFPAALTGPLDAQHRRELEDIQRQDVAASLARHNIMVDWREHKLAELIDWRDRVEVASLLSTDQNLDLDWRGMSLGDLNDIRLRASKSMELAAAFGVTIDWRLYSWRQLEELRRAVAKIQAAEVPNTAEGRGRKARVAAHARTGAPAVVTGGGTRADKEAILEL